MASRQHGPGGDDAAGARPTGSPDLPARDGRAPNSRTPSSPSSPSRPTTRRRPEDPPFRDPGLYALTDHFRERLGQAGRYVSTRTVSDAIRHGQLRWNRTDGWRFALVKDGVRFVVVVGDTETESPVVVTAWTEVADRDAALRSARWDETDVDTIAVRTALSDESNARIPDRIRPRTVTRPLEVAGHRLRTEPGDPALQCVECRRQFRSKRELTTRYCQGQSD